MYTLRKIEQDETDYFLGKTYTIIRRRREPFEIKKTINSHDDAQEEGEAKVFVVDCEGYLIPVYKSKVYYIVGVTGKTLRKINV